MDQSKISSSFAASSTWSSGVTSGAQKQVNVGLKSTAAKKAYAAVKSIFRFGSGSNSVSSSSSTSQTEHSKAIHEQVLMHSEKLTAALETLDKNLVRLSAIEARFADNPQALKESSAHGSATAMVDHNLSQVKDIIGEINNLPSTYKMLVVKNLNLQLMSPVGGFAYQNVMKFISDRDTLSDASVKSMVDAITRLGSATLQLGAGSAEEKGNVTFVCALAVDGMGDLGLAMNALDTVDKDKANARLVVLVGMADPITQSFLVEQQKQQLAKVQKMKGDNPNIQVVQVPLSKQLWGPGPPDLCKAESPENYQILQEVFAKTDVLVTVPVEYHGGEEQIRSMLPENARFMATAEYGLRMVDEEGASRSGPDRIETGPLKMVYINEGKKSPEKLFEILSNSKEVVDILPFANEGVDKQASFDNYSVTNNLSLFYLNPATPHPAIKAFFEHYMEIHKDDKRCLNIIGNIPDNFFEKKYLARMKKEYGVDQVVIHHKGNPSIDHTTTSKPGDPPKILHIYADYGFEKETFGALAEYSATTAGNYPNLFFAGGDGSFTDALTLMVNYSSNPENSKSVASLPIYIPRMRYHRQTVEDLITLCGQIDEPDLQKLFSLYKDMENIPSDDKKLLARLASSPEVKLGLARLSNYLSTEHNLSRNLRMRINDELGQSLANKPTVKEVTNGLAHDIIFSHPLPGAVVPTSSSH